MVLWEFTLHLDVLTLASSCSCSFLGASPALWPRHARFRQSREWLDRGRWSQRRTCRIHCWVPEKEDWDACRLLLFGNWRGARWLYLRLCSILWWVKFCSWSKIRMRLGICISRLDKFFHSFVAIPVPRVKGPDMREAASQSLQASEPATCSPFLPLFPWSLGLCFLICSLVDPKKRLFCYMSGQKALLSV